MGSDNNFQAADRPSETVVAYCALTGEVRYYLQFPVIRLIVQVKFIGGKCKCAEGEDPTAHWAIRSALEALVG